MMVDTNEYALNLIKAEIPRFSKCKDVSGKGYYTYHIVVTSPCPFRRWSVDRRYCQFLQLYYYFTKIRKIKTKFPMPSILQNIQLSLSKKALAATRIKILENFLIELLSIPDLTVNEMEQLYVFLDVDFNDNGERDSDFQDVRKSLFPEIGSPGSAFDSDTSFVDETQKNREVVQVGGEESNSMLRYSDIRVTNDLGMNSSESRSRSQEKSSYHLEHDSKQRSYSVSVEGMKEALRNNDRTAVDELLKKAKRLATAVDDAGNPIIYTAALYGAVGLGIALVAAGADPHAVNKQGISAMDVAFDPWRTAVQDYIDRMIEEKLAAETSQFQVFKTVIVKDAKGSIGLNIVKSPDYMPVVLSVRESHTSIATVVKPNDVIVGVNEIMTTDFKEIIGLIKQSEGSVQLVLRRELKY
jgi:hypothetical protein